MRTVRTLDSNFAQINARIIYEVRASITCKKLCDDGTVAETVEGDITISSVPVPLAIPFRLSPLHLIPGTLFIRIPLIILSIDRALIKSLESIPSIHRAARSQVDRFCKSRFGRL